MRRPFGVEVHGLPRRHLALVGHHVLRLGVVKRHPQEQVVVLGLYRLALVQDVTFRALHVIDLALFVPLRRVCITTDCRTPRRRRAWLKSSLSRRINSVALSSIHLRWLDRQRHVVGLHVFGGALRDGW